jgi:hypothetical protein
MSNQNNGGPAFPHVPESFVYVPGQGKANIPGTDGGMSLRDYFAARALAPAFPGMTTRDVQYAAEAAYELADAMLAARG